MRYETCVLCQGEIEMYHIFNLINVAIDPRINKPAPDFEAQSTNGKTVKLSEFKGSWVVLYFFPKAFTPG
jgi:peroxiredoxin